MVPWPNEWQLYGSFKITVNRWGSIDTVRLSVSNSSSNVGDLVEYNLYRYLLDVA